MIKSIVKIVIYLAVFIPNIAFADAWDQMNLMANESYTEFVGFPFASTTDYTQDVLATAMVFPIGFLDTNINELISWFIIIVIVLFGVYTLKFFKT